MAHVIRVNVSQKFINESTQQNARKCAIANAIKALFPDVYQASAKADFINISYHDGTVERYRTPLVAANAIKAFDRDKSSAKPFVLLLRDKDWVSTRPRRLNQPRKAELTQKKKVVAKATGRKVSSIKEEETSAFDEDGYATVPTVGRKVIPARKKFVKRSHRPICSD